MDEEQVAQGAEWEELQAEAQARELVRMSDIKCPKCNSDIRVKIVWIQSGEMFSDDSAIECTNWNCNAMWDKDGKEN